MNKPILPTSVKSYYTKLKKSETRDFTAEELDNMAPRDKSIISSHWFKVIGNNEDARPYTEGELKKMNPPLLREVLKYSLLKIVNKETNEWMDEYNESLLQWNGAITKNIL